MILRRLSWSPTLYRSMNTEKLAVRSLEVKPVVAESSWFKLILV